MTCGWTRRDFLLRSCAGVCSLGAATSLGWPGDKLVRQANAEPTGNEEAALKEVMFYDKLDTLRIRCQICPKECTVADQERGYCGNKENRGGKYYTLVYSQCCAAHVDPIEKKPLFHYLPGTKAFSISTAGCNFECRFCQNWQISQFRPEDVDNFTLTPETAANAAKRQGCETIAYTYGEPVVFYTYMYDVASVAREQGVGSVMISNGYIKEKPLRKLCEVLTGVKIDLKAFTEKFYKESCSGEMRPVLDALELLHDIGTWLEIVVLLVPTLNDSEAELQRMAAWVVDKLGPDVPMHFTRFHPTYKIRNLPPTPVGTLDRARDIALKAGVRFAYVGNMPGHPGENTYCPNCNTVLIRRVGFRILSNILVRTSRGAECPNCQTPIPGVWSQVTLG